MGNMKNINRQDLETGELLSLLKPFIARCLQLNHDLNNTLAGLIGYTEFLLDEDEPLTENQREYLRQIITCAERLEKEITDLCNEKIELSQKIDIKRLFSIEE